MGSGRGGVPPLCRPSGLGCRAGPSVVAVGLHRGGTLWPAVGGTCGRMVAWGHGGWRCTHAGGCVCGACGALACRVVVVRGGWCAGWGDGSPPPDGRSIGGVSRFVEQEFEEASLVSWGYLGCLLRVLVGAVREQLFWRRPSVAWVGALSLCSLCVRALCLCHLCVSALSVRHFLVSVPSVCVIWVSQRCLCVCCVSARSVSRCSVCHLCVSALCLCHLCVSVAPVCSLCQCSLFVICVSALCVICVSAHCLCDSFVCHLCVSVRLVVKSTAQHSTAKHNSTAQQSTAQQNCIAQHSTAQHSTAQHSTAQHSTAQHSAAQHSTAQHSTTQHSTPQHHTAQEQSTGCLTVCPLCVVWFRAT